MFYVLWIPLAVLSCAVAALLSKQLNDTQSVKWFWTTLIWQLFGVWPIVARYSKNLIFDALVYDLIILLVYYGILLFLGSGRSFTLYQWIALGIVCIGMVIFKVGG